MPIRRYLFIACAIFILLATTTRADVWFVPDDHQTIQAAIDAAIEGDEIIVRVGTYSGFRLNGKNLDIHSTNPVDKTIRSNTIIRGGAGGVIIFDGIENDTSRIAGFTITEGNSIISAVPNGSGIQGNGCFATIEYNRIFANQAVNPDPNATGSNDPWEGGGISDCDGIIRFNVVDRNFANRGAGLADCDGEIFNNIITRNRTRRVLNQGLDIPNSSFGSAMDNCNGKIYNNTIVDNFTSRNDEDVNVVITNAGGLSNCKGDILNNILWHSSTEARFQMMELDHSSTPTFSCVKGWTKGGIGNIASDPLFMNVIYQGLVPMNRLIEQDYRLHPDSPAIDAGKSTNTLTTDIEGNLRGFNWPEKSGGDGSNWDMGAYELTTTSLNLWIPDRPLEIQDGSQIEVKWLAYAEAGNTIQLSLHQDATFVADLGQFTAPMLGQIYWSTIQLPLSLPQNLPLQSGCTIVGTSIQDNQLTARTHPFTIIPRKNATTSPWPLYP